MGSDKNCLVMKKHGPEKSFGNGLIAKSAHEAFMNALEERKFFGIVETHFENGGIVRLKKIQTLMPRDIIKRINT